jgi:hypothetical protein
VTAVADRERAIMKWALHWIALYGESAVDRRTAVTAIEAAHEAFVAAVYAEEGLTPSDPSCTIRHIDPG